MYLLKLLSRCPFSLLYIFSDVVSFFLYHILRYRRQTSFTNIKNSFPANNEKQIRKIQKNAYRYLCDSFFELIKGYSISERELRSRVTISNTDLIREALDDHQSALLLTAHTAPTEWVGQMLHLKLGYYIDPVYKPAHSKLADNFIFNIRSRYQSTPIPYKKLAKDLITRKNIKRCIAILADLEPRRRDQSLKINFLNQPTRFFLSIDKIAKLANVPVFFIAIKRNTRGHYEAEIKKLCDNPNQMDSEEFVKAYAACVEEVIKLKPEAWLWTHRRWKHSTAV